MGRAHNSLISDLSDFFFLFFFKGTENIFMTKFTCEHSVAALCANSGKDTDLQVGVLSRSVHVQVCRAEGGGGERQDHGANTPHGQQGSAEGCPHWTQSKPGEVHTTLSDMEILAAHWN